MFPQNQYPNFTNFAYPSFPQEVDAPDSDPGTGDMICVTYSRSWTAVLMSACNQLIQLSSWKGTDEEKKLAASRAVNLQWQLQNDIGCEMGCCYDTVTRRITPDGGIEISVNGGDYFPDPSDPRSTAATYPPITMDGTHTKCDAASNVAEHLQNIISETSSQLGGTGSILEIAAAIVAAIFALFIAPETLPALAPVILPLIAGLLFVGQAAWDAYFDDTVDGIILCAVYCSISSDGTFTQDSYDGVISKLTATMPASPAKDYFIQIVQRIGLVGMNDYAAIGTSASADCSDCECGCPEIITGMRTGTFIKRDIDDLGRCYIRCQSADAGASEAIDFNFNASADPVSGQCAKYLGFAIVSGSPTTLNPYGAGCTFAGSPTYSTLSVNDCVSAIDFEDPSHSSPGYVIDFFFEAC
jgi:hypothetical protein